MARVRSWWSKSSGRVRVSVVAFMGLLCAIGVGLATGPFLNPTEANTPTMYLLYVTLNPDSSAGNVYLLESTYGTSTTYYEEGTLADGQMYADGTVIKVEAVPTSGDWVFDHWEGHASGSDNPKEFTMTFTRQITAVFAPDLLPTPQFFADPLSGNAPLAVAFTDDSDPGTGTISSWEWDFDNDSIIDSTAQNPVHTYNTPGTYSVSLTVTNENGSVTLTEVDLIFADDEPTSDFSASPRSGYAPLQVDFTDESFDNGTPIFNWAWDFDNDGTIDSNDQNPSHTYQEPGVYTVSLSIVSGWVVDLGDSNIETDIETKEGYIVVESGEPKASFTAEPLAGLAPLTVSFADTSDPGPHPITAWEWDFDNDGTIDSVEQHPQTTYEVPGVYSVTLRATNEAGVGSTTYPDYIRVFTTAVSIGNVETTLQEDAGTVLIPIELSEPTDDPVTVVVNSADGTAIAGEDYVPVEHFVSFAPNQIEPEYVPLTVMEDGLFESDQDFMLVLSDPTNAGLGVPSQQFTIEDNEQEPLFFVSSPHITVTESEGEVRIPLFITSLADSPLQVEVVVVEDSALAGVDYGEPIVPEFIPAGEKSVEVVVPIVNDGNPEGVERFFVDFRLNDPIITTPTRRATIFVADATVTPEVRFDQATATVNEADEELFVTLVLEPMFSEVVVVTLATQDNGATRDEDYRIPEDPVMFQPGETEKTIRIPIAADRRMESDESFVLSLDTVTNASPGTPDSMTITIQDLQDERIEFGFTGFGAVTLNPVAEDAPPDDQYVMAPGFRTFATDDIVEMGAYPLDGWRLDEWWAPQASLGGIPEDTDLLVSTKVRFRPSQQRYWWPIFVKNTEGYDLADPDEDGLANYRESEFGTDPENPDTDGDGLPDGWEVSYGLNPLSAAGDDGAQGDPDGDGHDNFTEYTQGWHPKR